jgi:hypothetical protein
MLLSMTMAQLAQGEGSPEGPARVMRRRHSCRIGQSTARAVWDDRKIAFPGGAMRQPGWQQETRMQRREW